jgi:peptide/nickel transport system permease protein
MGVWKYIARRLVFMIPMFIGISVMVFLIMYATGDPIKLIVRGNPRILQSAQALAEIKKYYGLDKPIIVQYLTWLWNFINLNLGKSVYGGRPVNLLVGSWAFETIKLQLVALVLSLTASIFIGILSARKQYSKTDYAVTTTALFGVSMPVFWVGIILILIFSFDLGWLPSNGAYAATKVWPSLKPIAEANGFDLFVDSLYHLALPALVLTFANLALYVRIIRSTMLEVLRQDYVLAARASGLPERMVIYSHAFRNALSPLLTLVGLYFGAIIAGAPITETVFSWPGLGRFYVAATLDLDFPVIMGITMIIVLMTLFANLVTDMGYAVVDPRVRVE